MTDKSRSISKGTFEGREADFVYRASQDERELSVQYRDDQSPALNISDNDIIYVAPRSPDSKEWVVKYLTHSDSSQAQPSALNISYHEAIVSEPPEQFIHNNAISGFFKSLLSSSTDESSTPLGTFYVVISTLSGTRLARAFYESIVHPALPASLDLQLLLTESETSITEFAQGALLEQANKGIPQTILLLSGDGGIVDILNALASHVRGSMYIKPVVGLIPMGTGNALANSTGLNKDHTRGLRSLFRGKPHSLPSFVVVFSIGAELVSNEGKDSEPLARVDEHGQGILTGAVVFSWALHASLVADSDTTEYRKYGRERFSMAAKELLSPASGAAPHKYKGKLTIFRGAVGTESVQRIVMERREHGYVLVTMVSNLEEKLTISPSSRPLDGKMRLVHFGPLGPERVMAVMGGAFQGGQHVQDSAVGYETVEGMRIDFEEDDEMLNGRWRRVCVDGKIVRVPQGGWVEMRKGTEDIFDIIADLEGT